ncbi:serine protease [Streptomyces sp. NRRL S-87]|uniref:trypsin-like serine peptidase n=1 Tax=Streptomyces sp. NRRL S-87 TaxID=1463920 RepID=UPI0004BF63E2|nr:serine protease [Streptomyces sp. NRRL S-87]
MLPRQARHVRTGARVLIAMTPLVALLGTVTPANGAHLPPGETVTARESDESDRVGALFAGGLDGGHYCTASVVRSDDRNLIATAAHCLTQDAGRTVFVPGYRDGDAPYGVWRLTGTYVDPGWTADEDPDADVAFATVAPLDGEEIEDVLGGFTVAPDQPDDVDVTVVGYPSTAEAPLLCRNETSLFSATQRRIECPDYSGGTSGSPWLTTTGRLVGVLGGYEGGGTVPEVSYSAVLGERARELYREAAVSGG